MLEFVKGLGEFVYAFESSYPSSLMRALALERLGRVEEARTAYLEAAESLEQEIERTPDDFRLHGQLGYAYAALGRREDALAAAERGLEMMPLEKGAFEGRVRLWELAAVNARLGNAKTAIEQVRTLIEFSGEYSVPFLEIDVYMDPVRDHPSTKSWFETLARGSSIRFGCRNTPPRRLSARRCQPAFRSRSPRSPIFSSTLF